MEAEQALRAAPNAERFFFDVLPLPAWVFHRRTFALVAVNPAAVNYFGYSHQELLSMSAVDLHPPEDRGAVMAVLRSANADTTRRWRLRTRDGTTRDMETFAHPWELGGRPVWLVVAHDVTDRKRAEAEWEAARAEAEAANRAKDNFLALLSHELRTPLANMVGWLTLLRSGKAPANKVPEILERLDRATHVQMRLVSDLLDVSRINSGKLEIVREPVDLVEIVHSAVESHRATAEIEQLHLVMYRESGRFIALADRVRLEQAIGNLIDNAVKFTPRGGRVEVSLEQRNGHARVTVKDTGKGIARELLPHVFDRFRQGDASSTTQRRGLGLGLAIVRYVVGEHGGRVRAESAGPGLGATFSVDLPLHARGSEAGR